MRTTLLALALAALVACAGTLDPSRLLGAAPAGADAAVPDAAALCPDVPQLLASACGAAGCHAPPSAAAGLDLASPDVASRLVGVRATSGDLLADPDAPSTSVLYLRVSGASAGPRMPEGAPPLADADVACVLAWIEGLSAPAAPADASADVPAADATPPGTTTLRIAAGQTADYTDTDGNVWSADEDYTGGTSAAAAAPLAIANTKDPTIYSGQRYGTFSYQLPVTNGAYTVTLKFAEIYDGITGPGQRVFDVSINGATVLTGFDIFAVAGARDVAHDETFAVDVTTGAITVELAPGAKGVQNPMLNSLAVTPRS
jgi:hypothetical protein